MKKLTDGEKTFRLTLAVIIIIAIYNPGAVGKWILWILASILLITGFAKACPLVYYWDKK